MLLLFFLVKLAKEIRIPILCKPNAGNPVIDAQGQAQYDMAPGEFAEIVTQCKDNGAALLGGCCGTAPEFIRALRDSLIAK